jgi:CHRD domain
MRCKDRKSHAALALLVISVCATMLLTACTPTTQTANADGVTHTPANAAVIPTSTTTTASTGSTTAAFAIHADLKHSPKARADLTWSATNQDLRVKITATGLAPSSAHPVHIHLGSCAKNTMGKMLYTLTTLQSDAHGNGTSETIIQGVQNGIPASGWYINIHNGPTLNTELEARPIACGDVTNGQAATQTNQIVHLDLVATTAPDEAVHGTASVSVENNAIVITLAISGLIPNSTHMAHIHVGSCESQGPVLYPLQQVSADNQGNSTTKTTIDMNKLMNLPATQLYINVHEAGTMEGMKTTQGFNPIACGNIELSKA